MNPPEWQSWFILAGVFLGPPLFGLFMYFGSDRRRGW